MLHNYVLEQARDKVLVSFVGIDSLTDEPLKPNLAPTTFRVKFKL